MASVRSNFLPALLAFIGVVGLVVFGVLIFGISSDQQSAAGLPGANVPLAPPVVSPVGLHSVELFDPNHIVVQSQDGVIVSSDIDSKPIVAIEAKPGRWQNVPGELPGMVFDPERQPYHVKPGYPSGTTVILGHAKVHPSKVFTPLMQVPDDPVTLRNKQYEAFLYGSSCQVLTYRITAVEKPVRGQPHGHLHENLPNRLLIYTCEVEDGQTEVTNNRVLVGELSSAVSSCG